MKKGRVLTIAILLSVVLCACGENVIPDLPPEEMQQVEEYAAQLLLKYDKNYTNNVISEEELQKEEELLRKKAELAKAVEEEKRRQEESAKQEEDKHNNDASSSTEGNGQQVTENYQADIDEFLGFSGIQMEYTGYEICDSFPHTTENDWQGVARASGSNKLVVFKFDVTSESDGGTYLDVGAASARVTFKVNKAATKSALTTLLANDFLHFRGNIQPGENKELVMIIELPGSDAENLESVVMQLKVDDRTAKTTLF